MLVISDSGDIQEETTYLNIPRLTLRDTTERPITATQGSNRIVTCESLCYAVAKVKANEWPNARPIDLWDDQAGQHAAESLEAVAQSK